MHLREFLCLLRAHSTLTRQIQLVTDQYDALIDPAVFAHRCHTVLDVVEGRPVRDIKNENNPTAVLDVNFQYWKHPLLPWRVPHTNHTFSTVDERALALHETRARLAAMARPRMVPQESS